MGISRDKKFKVLSGASTSEVIMSTNNKVKPFDNKLVSPGHGLRHRSQDRH